MNKPYKTAIIGGGKMACGFDTPDSLDILTHAHAITQSQGFDLVGIYDVDNKKSKLVASKWNTKAFCSLEEVRTKCDVVCCAVPDNAHFDVLRSIVDCKRLVAVICEKPIATKMKDAEEIVSLYKEKKIPIVVNYSRRFMNGFRNIKERIRDCGKLIIGNCYYGKGLFHNGSHMINILDYLIGLDDFNVGDVIGSVDDFEKTDKSIEFYLKNDNAIIYFHVIPCNITTVFQFELCFENGKISYDDTTEEICFYEITDSSKFAGYTNYTVAGKYKAVRNEALPLLYHDVKELLEGREINYSDGKSAAKTLEKCFMVSENMC